MNVAHTFETVGDASYRRIRSDIIFGRLPAAQKLKLERLKADYGVSVSTLREILNRLTADGLVVAEGQRGFEVAPMSAENLREVAEIRQLLECHALEQSFGSGDIDWEARVVAAHHKLAMVEKRMAESGDDQSDLWKRYDCEFHQALISACGSAELLETHAQIFDKYQRYQMLAMSFRGDVSSREHKQLLDAALARDARAAGKVLVAHIAGGVASALAASLIV